MNIFEILILKMPVTFILNTIHVNAKLIDLT